ncbi:MAG: ribonuclease III [Myxococcales bacterium]|nr:ribonuclease III [Myxococcales bacterium]
MTLGYRFADEALLALALTHPSAVLEGGAANNQRLEFLGDAVLQLLVTDWLVATHPSWTEGRLSKARAAVVRKETLAALADHFEIPAALRLGAGAQRDGTRQSVNVRSDALEAVLGAVYLDGGLGKVRGLVIPALMPWLQRADEAVNPRSALQEWAAGRGLGPPEYRDLGAEGPPHSRRFDYEVHVAGEVFGPASGTSRRTAMAAAATLAVATLLPGHVPDPVGR